MIPHPATREHGQFEPGIQGLAQPHHPVRGHPGRARKEWGRKDWAAGAAVLALIAGMSLWLVNEHARMNGASLISETEAASLTDSTSPNGVHVMAMPNLDALATRIVHGKLSAEDVRVLQTRLKDMGFEPGIIDGIAGGRTLDALNRYRASERLAPADRVDYGSVGHLLD